METFHSIFLSTFFLLALVYEGAGIATCSQPNSLCSTDQQCCSISNGKSYCNAKTKQCEALRYCDSKSPSNQCPFNDLSAKEIENVVKIVKESKKFGLNLNFPIVRNQEPKKKFWNSGDNTAKERIAYAAVYDLDKSCSFEVLVSLKTNRILSVQERKDSVPPMTTYEYTLATDLLRKDPRIKQAYERRGLNISNAAFDIWAYGLQKDDNVIGRRRVKLVANYRDPIARYMDWSPVEGLSATVDIADKKIVDFIDKGDVPVPKAPCIIDKKDNAVPPKSESLPKSSVEISGYQIKWQNFRFQYSMDPLHGLQLYHIRYLADCEERFIIYKISLSEMLVPYGADGETWRWRGAFDVGEYGLGKSVSPLLLGKDVPSNARLLSCPQLNDLTGEVSSIEGCIAVYERDNLPMYKHYDSGSDTHDSIAGTELVITSMSTIGNYDYFFEFVFSMDGNVRVGVNAVGLILLRGFENEKNDPNCIEDCHDYVNEHTVGALHQHFFNYRIDFDIDGTNNLLTEVDFANDPKGPANRDGGAFSLYRTVLRNETSRDFSAKNARFWSTINPQSRNSFNTPRGYSIHPESLGHTFLKPGPGSPLNQAIFLTHPIWATVYNDTEQGAAGPFPRSGIPGQGLPEYIKDQESLYNEDVVVWHTFAITHAPRPEEFPFMNKMHSGFLILSRNFQSANPVVGLCKDRCNECKKKTIKRC